MVEVFQPSGRATRQDGALPMLRKTRTGRISRSHSFQTGWSTSVMGRLTPIRGTGVQRATLLAMDYATSGAYSESDVL